MDRLSDVKVRQCIQPSGATVFHGECEWYPGQLEEELVTGAWQVSQPTSADLPRQCCDLVTDRASCHARSSDGQRCWQA